MSALALALSQLLLILPARAAIFPDVPDGSLYQTYVENLAGLKVINGNPDGTFLPEKSVNRAEMLSMLYRAKGLVPDSHKRGCFPDVQPGSWYELTVCDAASRGYINGYSDGYFRPNREVNRVEALKMIATVFKMDVPEVASSNWAQLSFTDVSSTQWYAKFVLHAYNMSIIPIPGMDVFNFKPESFLKRGEAAAFIYNALHASPRATRSSSSSSMQSSSMRSVSSAQTNSAQPIINSLVIPSSVSGNFKDKAPAVYRFTVTASMMLAIDVKIGGAYSDSDITCRLYALEDSGFTSEYYLGYQEQGLCQLRTKIAPGNYQLELQAPSVSNAVYTIDVKTAKGDNNDGFSEAKTLLNTQPKSDQLDIGDLADWYKFSLTADTQMTLNLISDGTAGCIVYAMDDVDIYGFSSPNCNESYLYPKGTYYVGVIRKNDRHDKIQYTLQRAK